MPEYDLAGFAELLSRTNGMQFMRPVIEKELLHYEILSTLEKSGLLSSLVFQGGTCLRLCYGASRYSEDLDFAGEKGWDTGNLNDLKFCIENSFAKKFQLAVSIDEPDSKNPLTSRWRIGINTAPDRRDIPVQKISVEVAAIPAYTRKPRMLRLNYEGLPSSYADTIVFSESLEEILADKLESFVCASYIRYRDIWDIHWIARQPNLDMSKVYELRKLKEADYGESEKFGSGLVRITEQLQTIVNSKEFGEQMKRFLPSDLFARTLSRVEYREAIAETIRGIYAGVLR